MSSASPTRFLICSVVTLGAAGLVSGQEIPDPQGPYVAVDPKKKRHGVWTYRWFLEDKVAPWLPVPGKRFPAYREVRRAFRYRGPITVSSHGMEVGEPRRDIQVFYYRFPDAASARLACTWFAWERATYWYNYRSRPLDDQLRPPWLLDQVDIADQQAIWHQGYAAWKSRRYRNFWQEYFWPTRDNGLLWLVHINVIPAPTRYLAALVKAFPPAKPGTRIERDFAVWMHRAGPALIDSLAAARDPEIRQALDGRLRRLVLAERDLPESATQPDVPPRALLGGDPAALVRGWDAWWRKHGGLARIDWCRLQIDDLVRRASRKDSSLPSRTCAVIDLMRLVSRIFRGQSLQWEMEPPGVSGDDLVMVLRSKPPNEPTAAKWRRMIDKLARQLSGWWRVCRANANKPVRWYHELLRLYLVERNAGTWMERNYGLLQLELATLGQCPAELRLTRWLEPEVAPERYAAWERWLEGEGRRFCPVARPHDYDDAQITRHAPPWLRPLLPLPSWTKRGLPYFSDLNDDELVGWLSPLRRARLADIRVSAEESGRRDNQDDLTYRVHLELAEHRREVPLDWWNEKLWAAARKTAVPGVFWVPEYARWGAGGVTALVRHQYHVPGEVQTDEPIYVLAYWVSPSRPGKWWVITLEGPLEDCRRLARWVQKRFPSTLQAAGDIGDWDAHLRRYVELRLRMLDDPRLAKEFINDWGKLEQQFNPDRLMRLIKPDWPFAEKLPRGYERYFELRKRVRGFWAAHGAETESERFRRSIDSIFAVLRDPRRTPRWRVDNTLYLVMALQRACQIPKSGSGMFPLLSLKNDDDPIVKQAIEDWHNWWRKSRTLPRTEFARALLDQHIRWLPKQGKKQSATDAARDRAELLHLWLKPYLPADLARIDPYRHEHPQKLEQTLGKWWRENREKCFVKLPPWYF